MQRLILAFAAAAWAVSGFDLADCQAAGQAQVTLDQAAAQQKYTFLLFYKENDAATQSAAQTLRSGIAARGDKATYCLVPINDLGEKDVVDRFRVSRAPMPLTIAVAPNGAVTGFFVRNLVEANIASSFVTPTKMYCMKSLQEGKLVMVCVNAEAEAGTPVSVHDFRMDPQFSQRLNVASIYAGDPIEASFVQQMGVDPAKIRGTTIVFMAPPNALVGMFDLNTTKAQMAAALHNAGKCCDDPNCKHNHAAPSAQATPPNARQANQLPSLQRN